MKRILLIAVSAVALNCAAQTALEVSNVKTGECATTTITQPGEKDRTHLRSLSAEVTRGENALSFQVKNFLAECESDYDVTAAIDGNILTITPFPLNPAADPCYCRRQLSFNVKVPEGIGNDLVVNMVGQPKENGLLVLNFILSDYCTAGFFVDQYKPFFLSQELVLYNEGDAAHDPFFIYLRADQKKENEFEIYWQNSSISSKKLGTIIVDDLVAYVEPADVDIPATFWGLNMGVETINPFKCLNGEKVKIFDYSQPQDENVYAYDLLKGELKGITKANSVNYTPVENKEAVSDYFTDFMPISQRWRDGGHSFKSGNIEGGHMREIGAFGQSYASNPIYPIYEMPEGAVPTSFSFLAARCNCGFLIGTFLHDGGEYLTQLQEHTGVEEVSDSEPGQYYNLQGQPVSNPAHGLFIRTTPSGACKVLIP